MKNDKGKNGCAELEDVVAFINSYLGVGDFKDYDGAKNGLQCSNSGKVTAIASAVDAGLGEIKVAAHMGADLLIAHHGMFWSPPIPFTGGNYDKIKTLVDSDMAVYACHLPLDAHPQIGNNALIAKALKLRAISSCFEYYGREIGVLAVPVEHIIHTGHCINPDFNHVNTALRISLYESFRHIVIPLYLSTRVISNTTGRTPSPQHPIVCPSLLFQV